MLFVSLSSFGNQSHHTETLANEDSSYFSLRSDTAMKVQAWRSWPRCWSSRKRLKAMFVVVMVVMIEDSVEAVIVMSAIMMIMIMILVDGMEKKVCQKEKRIQPFPNE